jgi:hypothetical protein
MENVDLIAAQSCQAAFQRRRHGIGKAVDGERALPIRGKREIS